MRLKHVITGLLAITSSICTVENQITPYISIRSQGLNTPRHLVGSLQQTYVDNSETLHGTAAIALEYSRNFHNDDIKKCLFGTECCPQINISGSRIANRGEHDWLADYLYLPTDFKSSLSFDPRIDNVTTDFMFYIGLDDWTPGLFMSFYAPLVHTRWHLNMCETVDLKGTNSHLPGYFSPDTLQRNQLLENATDYLGGALLGPISQTVAGQNFTSTFQPLRNAQMPTKQENQTRLADIRACLGYNVAQYDRFQAGIGVVSAFPTGNRPEGEIFFEPIAGNGHHWEFGGQLSLAGKPYLSADHSNQIIMYMEAQLTHLFSARQRRTFDLSNRPFSRYMLIERLATPITDNLKGNGTAPSAQYFNELLPVANLSNVCVDVSASLQAEATFMTTFVCDTFSWDIGYNFWYRGCESIKLFGVHPFDNNTKWALKGDAHIFGFDRGATGDDPLNGAIPLSATQSDATMQSGTNFVDGFTQSTAIKNPNIDNPQNATGDVINATANNPLSADPFSNATTIQTSINPIFLKTTDLNVCEVTTRGLSSKLFMHFNYTWKECHRWTPYLGIGGQVEFAHNNDNCEKDCTKCTTCIDCAINQWGVWIKGGITY